MGQNDHTGRRYEDAGMIHGKKDRLDTHQSHVALAEFGKREDEAA